MVLSRLFIAEAELHLRNKGFLRSRQWFCSSPSRVPSPSPKKVSERAVAAKEKRAEAIRSFVRRYMATHPGIFPKAKEVHDGVGGSWYIVKKILTEMKTKMLPDARSDVQPGSVEARDCLESISEATVFEENGDSCMLDKPDKGFGLLTEKLDILESRNTADKNSTMLSTVKISDNAEPVEAKQIIQSTDGLTSSAPVLGEQLIYADTQTVEEGEITGTSNTDICSSEAKLIEVTYSGNGDCSTDINCLAPNHNAPATAINCQVPNQNVMESNICENRVTNLVKFFKRSTETREGLSCTKINTPKHEMLSDLKENSKHIINLVDVFRKNQSVSIDSSVICEKSVKQDILSNPKEVRGEDSERRSGVKDLVKQIIGLTKEKQKNGSWASDPSNKPNRFNKTLRGFVHESLNFPNLVEERTSINQLDKNDVRKTEVLAKRAASGILNLGPKDRQQKEPDSCESENGKLQLDKDRNRMDSSDIPYSEVLSEESDSDVAAFDYPKLESSNEVPLSAQGLNLNAHPREETGNHISCLLVKFLLKTAKTNDISLAFGDCGPIAEIHIVPSRRENRYNYAYIWFKTEEGLRKALSKADLAVCCADVVVEPASPSITHRRIFYMEPLDDTDFPVTFLKNPTRAVMVKGLPDNLSFHHLRHTLSFWGNISGFAMGSSCSSVYVEFESEESKERVIAEATISVSGKKLLIFRVDQPKTTVVRISNVNSLSGVAKIRSICDSYGRVKRLFSRDIDTFDVHFKLSEWGNMVKILNRLNGLVVDQNQWVAQPATAVPAEVLQALWNKPEGRKHVHELIRNLCRKIEEKSISTAPMLSLAREYYGE